jgi:hypothetical protein
MKGICLSTTNFPVVVSQPIDRCVRLPNVESNVSRMSFVCHKIQVSAVSRPEPLAGFSRINLLPLNFSESVYGLAADLSHVITV